jgi:hypothetical protein
MTFFPDLGTITMAAAGPHVRAVGWLDSDHEFPQGDPPSGFVERLQRFSQHWGDSAEVLGLNLFLGGHTCEFCNGVSGSGSFGVASGELLFVCPDLIAHYVRCHHYLPPSGFVDAVLRSPLPGTNEYRVIVGRFRHLPVSPEDEQRIGEAVRTWCVKVRRKP